MNNLVRDARFGLRMLLKGRGVSAIVVITLALAIGVTSTIVSLVGAVLVHPFPDVKDPSRVVWFFERKGDAHQSTTENLGEAVPVANFFAWKAATTQFEDLAAIKPDRQTVEGGGEPVRVKGFAATPNYFRLMGNRMAFGRDFNPDEDTPGRDRVAILGYAFAERRFGTAAAAVGQTITTQGTSRTVIGVLSRSFAFPGLTDLWIPLVVDAEMRANRSHTWLIVFGRLKAGATTAAANEEVAIIAPRLAAEFPDTNRGKSAQVLMLQEVFIGRGRTICILTLLVALLTLLVASTNIGNILYAQGTARRGELALRVALGASRARLIGQLLIESLVLCAAGGVLGCLVSIWGLDLFIASMPQRVADRMRLYWDLRFDASWAAVAAGVTLLTTLAAGLWPALRVSNTSAGETLKEQGNHATLGRSHRRVLRSLVTAQVAIALALLTGAACGAIDLVMTERRKLGFETTGVLEALVTRDQEDEQDNVRFFTDLLERLRAIPEASTVGLVSVTPLSRGDESVQLAIPGRPPAPPGQELEAKLTIVGGDYFAAGGIRVLEGNVFAAKDDRSAPAVALLSRRAAETFFPSQNALGKTIVQLEEKTQTLCTIIGIVDDIASYRHEEVGMVYRPFAQQPRSGMFALVRGTDPTQFDRSVHDAVHALDHRQPVETRPLQVHIDEYLWAPRTTVRLIVIPAILTMLLAVLGVYGVAAYSVTQRRPELGIRAALGASPRALVRLVMREALWIAGIGGTVGLTLSLLLVMALRKTVTMEALSPAWTFALTAALFLVVLLASYGPARRAAGASPSLAMRS
ncbi:MAG TPA: ABC transporter permease [Polyangiaceae bacterium]|nr:ABC transporter permease [Polyangiaceae bacterium]